MGRRTAAALHLQLHIAPALRRLLIPVMVLPLPLPRSCAAEAKAEWANFPYALPKPFSGALPCCPVHCPALLRPPPRWPAGCLRLPGPPAASLPLLHPPARPPACVRAAEGYSAWQAPTLALPSYCDAVNERNAAFVQ